MARRSTAELIDQLEDLVAKYAGKISRAEAIGCLAIVMMNLRPADEDEDGDDDKEKPL